MIYTKQEIAHIAIDAAEQTGIPAALVCAIIEVSSQWNPSLREWEPEQWLLMNHPNDFRGGEQEYIALGTRWGLMQFTGSRLRAFEWPGPYTAELGEPEMNLKAGCHILKKLLASGSKNVLIHWYGIERRRMADLTLRLLPTFEAFVAARPQAAGKAVEEKDPVLPWRRQPKSDAAAILPK